MDQMMAESSVARKKVEKQKQRQRKKESKTFGSGMKGGFFSAPKKSKKKGGNKKGSSKVREARVAVQRCSGAAVRRRLLMRVARAAATSCVRAFVWAVAIAPIRGLPRHSSLWHVLLIHHHHTLTQHAHALLSLLCRLLRLLRLLLLLLLLLLILPIG